MNKSGTFMNTELITGHSRQISHLESLIAAKKIPHSILFTGPSGTGKKIIAKRFLGSLLCMEEHPPCLKCSVCRQMEAGLYPDFIEVSPNEKGIIPIGSEEKKEPGTVRWLIERLSMKSISGNFAALIDGIDNINEEGQNALLKTIEEAGDSTYLVFIASNRAGILQTVISRCFEIKFNPLSDGQIREIITGKGIDRDTADKIAPISGGSVETALLLSDNDIFSSIMGICGEISSYLAGHGSVTFDPGSLIKKISSETLIDIIINYYRINMISILGGDQLEHPGNNIFIDDIIRVRNLIKVLFIARKGIPRNLNIRNAIRGMLYSKYMKSGDDLPFMSSLINLY